MSATSTRPRGSDAPAGALRASFRERDRCPLCGGSALSTVWRARFRDEPVRSWLQRCRYDADLEQALGDAAFERVACGACSMTFHRRVLDDPWLAILYERWISPRQIEAFEAAEGKHEAERAFGLGVQLVKHVLRLRHLLSDLGARRARVLDFGCGDGAFLATARLLGVDGAGVDCSASRQERAGRAGIDIVPDLESLDARGGGPFDAATLFEVLEHVPEPAGLLEALAQRVRRGGVLLVEVPDCRGITVPRDFTAFSNVHPLEHLNHFTPATLRAMCARAGFIPVGRVPAHVTTSPLAVLRTEASRVLTRPTTSQYFRRR